jgi:hypothetical protein
MMWQLPANLKSLLSCRVKRLTGEPALAHACRTAYDDPGGIGIRHGGVDCPQFLCSSGQRPLQVH